jgi:hypothetical protein
MHVSGGSKVLLFQELINQIVTVAYNGSGRAFPTNGPFFPTNGKIFPTNGPSSSQSGLIFSKPVKGVSTLSALQPARTLASVSILKEGPDQISRRGFIFQNHALKPIKSLKEDSEQLT